MSEYKDDAADVDQCTFASALLCSTSWMGSRVANLTDIEASHIKFTVATSDHISMKQA